MAEAARSPGSSEPTVALQRRRSQKVWNNRAAWDSVYQEAYDYVLPNRMPGGLGKAKRPAQMIFDMTGPNAAMHCAGEIQRQVFPASTPFMIETGPLVAAQITLAQKKALNRELTRVANSIYPYFQTGDFDTAIHEMCTDLTIGTGAILPIRGPSIEQPLGFVCIPQGEIAIAQDAWGRVNFVSWKRENLGREAIVEAWPNGRFDKEFRDAAKKDPYGEITVFQDFFRLPDGRWRFAAYLEKGEEFIVQETYRTQPIAVARFYRWPGEAYGRGPVLFALPSIKTANKAQELALKAAAIQMLGIWGFRSGGTFNPDTVRVGAGEFWPMQSTGGVLGPDVQRLDPASGRLDVARMVQEGLQSQIREALLDTRIHDKQGTPRAASEIAAVVQQNATVHIGAYGRLNSETTQVVVPRAMEILHEWGLLPQLMVFNQLLVTMQVNSPMAAALKADEFRAMTNYLELAAAVRQGAQLTGRDVNADRFMDRAREIMLVTNEIVPTEQERAQADQQAQAEQMAAVAGEMATRAAPQLAQGLMAEEAAQ